MKMATVRRHALAMPGVTEAPHHNFGAFRVKGKIFATMPPGDELLHIFLPDAERDQALALYPEWAAKLTWGAKVPGVRVTLALADTRAVKSLLDSAYRARAG